MLERVNALLEHDERPAAEKQRLAQLICLFAELPPPPDPYGLYSRYAELKGRFERAGPDNVVRLGVFNIGFPFHSRLSTTSVKLKLV